MSTFQKNIPHLVFCIFPHYILNTNDCFLLNTVDTFPKKGGDFMLKFSLFSSS